MIRAAMAGVAGSALVVGLLAGGSGSAQEDKSDERLQPKLNETAEQIEEDFAISDEEFNRLADETGIESSEVTAQGERTIVKIHPTSDIPNERVGVAQTVKLRFPVPITRKGAVERRISVVGYHAKKKKRRKTVDLPNGRWAWLDDQTAVYRTKKFWPGNTNVKFRLALKDVVVSNQGNTSYVGGSKSERVETLKLARSFVMLIRNRTHKMYVYRNGKLKRTFGVSLGKSRYETRSGVKVLTGIKYRNLRMRGTDRYTGERWDVMSPYSQPLTTNGEFIHAAPWARYRIGYANGSHGCTNMNIEDARWLYHRTLRGDPVVTKGTGRSMYASLAYGQGKYWTYEWRNWKKKSALPMKLKKPSDGKQDSKKDSKKG